MNTLEPNIVNVSSSSEFRELMFSLTSNKNDETGFIKTWYEWSRVTGAILDTDVDTGEYLIEEIKDYKGSFFIEPFSYPCIVVITHRINAFDQNSCLIYAKHTPNLDTVADFKSKLDEYNVE